MNSLSGCKFAVLFVVTMFSLFDLQVVDAATSDNKTMVACSSLKGQITIRQKCRKNEVRLTLNTLISQGPSGVQGPKGDRGVSAFDVIPSGTTVYGVLGAALPLPAGEEYVLAQTIPGVLPTPLTNATVVIANNAAVSSCTGHCLTLTELGESGKCGGTFEAPTAPPGLVCVYVFTVSNIDGGTLEAGSGPPNTDPNTTMITPGFYVSWAAHVASHSSLGATWAYTAP